MKLKYLLFMSIFSFILGSCKQIKFDKLVYESYNSSLAPEYRERYIIEVTKDSIVYTSLLPNSSNYELTKEKKDKSTIDSDEFGKIKNKVYDSGVINCKSSEDCDGGGTQTITGYKKGKSVFSNTHFGCSKDCDGFYELLNLLNSYKPTN